MSSVNKVILVGRLGADPELRYTTSGQAVCKLSVATNWRSRDAEGNSKEHTDWHKVSAWGKQAELCKSFLTKGRQIYIEGRLRNSSYDDKEGVRRHSTEVVSQSVVFLERGSSDRGALERTFTGSPARTQPAEMSMTEMSMTEMSSMTGEQRRVAAAGDDVPF